IRSFQSPPNGRTPTNIYMLNSAEIQHNCQDTCGNATIKNIFGILMCNYKNGCTLNSKR
ncbi:unnamed protein product, partial [Tenebrio molitor]